MVKQESTSVRLMHYDPRWRQEYKQTCSGLLHACEGWLCSVEHIGSTAIPGMIAQPTIDVLAGVKHEHELSEAAIRIEGLNFVATSEATDSLKQVTLQKPRRLVSGQNEPTHRVFLMLEGSDAWLRALLLRDYLASQPEVALQYEEVKMLHWKECQGDRAAYELAKAIYLTHLVDQIEAAKDNC